jgi:acetyltransferase-like isoleucine patch superfamily enzyme
MGPDQWLAKIIAKFIHWRYAGVLEDEAHKWGDMLERNRLARLKRRLGACGQDITLRPGVQILNPEQVHFGNHIALGYHTILHGRGGITLEDFALLGDNIVLATSSHPTEQFHFHNTWQKPIHIGENAWLGAGVIVLPGVTIGANAAIGAGAVVTQDIPPDSVAVGVPARVIQTLHFSPEELQQQKEAIRALRLGRIHSAQEGLRDVF